MEEGTRCLEKEVDAVIYRIDESGFLRVFFSVGFHIAKLLGS